MDVLFVDVRTKEEYEAGHKRGAVNIPVDEIFARHLGILETLENDAPLRLYCRSGARSERAKEMLRSYGFTDVVNLGGLEDAENNLYE